MKFLVATALSLLSAADAATRVAVIEIGSAGTVHKTNAKSPDTSVEGVASFWGALHSPGRKLQHAGMEVVPDLFSKPSDGLVIGISKVDLDTMPIVNSLMTEEGDAGVVGHMEVSGEVSSQLFGKLDEVEQVPAEGLSTSAKKHCKKSGISGIQVESNSKDAAGIDSSVSSMLQELQKIADAESQTFIVHLVVEEEEGAGRRRHLARRLSEDEEDADNEGENNDNNGEENGDNADGENAQQASNGFYGYAYYENDQWVTPYRTMFQIQYFNVVLWTALGLFAIVFFAVFLMVNMPLMEDTLLFGQSAKMSVED